MTRASTVFAALATAVALAGCGISDPYATQPGPTNEPEPSTPAIATAAAVKVAERYARAARSSSASTARRNYARQLQLAGAPLRTQLRSAGAPSRAELDAMRSARARTTATVVKTSTMTAAPGNATLSITLRERHTETGFVQETETRNTATLQRRAGAWKVTAFTATP